MPRNDAIASSSNDRVTCASLTFAVQIAQQFYGLCHGPEGTPEPANCDVAARSSPRPTPGGTTSTGKPKKRGDMAGKTPWCCPNLPEAAASVSPDGPPAPTTNPLGGPMSARFPAGVVHLLPADEVGWQGYGMSTPIALCGELVGVSELPAVPCPPDCQDEHQYCPACVREALRWNADFSEPESTSLARNGHGGQA